MGPGDSILSTCSVQQLSNRRAIMPNFFFHLVSSDLYDLDEIGCELPDVEAAYLEARAAAVEMIAEMLSSRRDPSCFQFEIFDAEGRFMIELPFSEVLNPQSQGAKNLGVRSSLQSQISRSRKLHGEISTELKKSRSILELSQRTLMRAQAH